MATTKIYPKELNEKIEEYDNFQLCYIDSIPQTYYDLTPESREMSKTPEYIEYAEKRSAYLDELLKKNHSYSSRDWEEYDWEHDPSNKFKRQYQEYPNEDIVDGYTHYLYFTNNMEKQWGDDWGRDFDSGSPYDHETDIIQVPVCIDYYKLMKAYEDEESYEDVIKDYPNYNYSEVNLPKDWDNYGGKCLFTVEDINHGAAAWVYATLRKRRYIYKSVAIYAGESPKTVMKKIGQVNNLLTMDMGDGEV